MGLRRPFNKVTVGRFWAPVFVLCLALGTSLAPSDASAERTLWERGWYACAVAVARLRYGGYRGPKLSSAEVRALRETFDGGTEFPSFPRNHLDRELFWHLYSELPETVRQVLERIPEGDLRERLFFDDLGDQIPEVHFYFTFVGNIREKWDDARMFRRATVKDIGAWLREGYAWYAEQSRLDGNLRARMRDRHRALLQVADAGNHWMRAFVAHPPVEELGGGRVRIVIGGNSLEGRVEGDMVSLTVPRRLVAHPSWNPLETKKLIAMSQNRVDIPDSWDTVLGHDGLFYLTDGNHRFAVTVRDPVVVRVSYPVRTVTLRNYLDLWGITQPTLDDVIRLHSGELGYWDLLPPSVHQRIVLPPADAGPRPAPPSRRR